MIRAPSLYIRLFWKAVGDLANKAFNDRRIGQRADRCEHATCTHGNLIRIATDFLPAKNLFFS